MNSKHFEGKIFTWRNVKILFLATRHTNNLTNTIQREVFWKLITGISENKNSKGHIIGAP